VFDPGFRADGVLVAPLQLRQLGYTPATANRFYSELLERLRRAPGVTAATFTNLVPLSGNEESHAYVIPGFEPPKGQKAVALDSAEVAPGYFETLQIPIVHGRSFEDRDLGTAVERVIVNQEFVRRYWPGQDPIGKQLLRGTDDGPIPVEVIGVARDAKYYSLGEAPMPFLYTAPSSMAVGAQIWVMIRSDADQARASEILRGHMTALDSRFGRISITSFEQLREGPLFPQRVLATVSFTFSGAALLLMTIGLYGMLAQSVQQRTREIGLRLAVGARPQDVMTMVVSRGLMLAAAGAFLGLSAVPFMGGALKRLLFGVTPADPITLATTAALLLVIALLATLLPARRASRVDPLSALRYE
jgi:predicted permease